MESLNFLGDVRGAIASSSTIRGDVPLLPSLFFSLGMVLGMEEVMRIEASPFLNFNAATRHRKGLQTTILSITDTKNQR